MKSYNDISALVDKGQENPRFLKEFFSLLGFTGMCFGIGISLGLCFEATIKWIIGY